MVKLLSDDLTYIPNDVLEEADRHESASEWAAAQRSTLARQWGEEWRRRGEELLGGLGRAQDLVQNTLESFGQTVQSPEFRESVMEGLKQGFMRASGMEAAQRGLEAVSDVFRVGGGQTAAAIADVAQRVRPDIDVRARVPSPATAESIAALREQMETRRRQLEEQYRRMGMPEAEIPGLVESDVRGYRQRIAELEEIRQAPAFTAGAPTREQTFIGGLAGGKPVTEAWETARESAERYAEVNLPGAIVAETLSPVSWPVETLRAIGAGAGALGAAGAMFGGLVTKGPKGTKQVIGAVTRAFGIEDPGRTYQFRTKVVDLDDLVPSHTDSLAANPDFPRELQPRLRDRDAARLQVDEMASRLNPDALLTDVQQLDRGSPIVGPDDVVESGNGRVLAMRLARREYPEQWQEYQRRLREVAPELGIDPATLEGMEHPVLVRERVSDVDRVAFTREANARATMAMGTFEQAVQDAERISDDVVLMLEVGEGQTIDRALTASENLAVARRFVDSLPANERAAVVTAEGRLNAAGLQRLKDALLVKTFGGASGRKLSEAFTESIDPGVKAIENGVYGALGDLARAEALVRAGKRAPDLTIVEDLAAAINKLAELRAEGTRVDDYLAQAQMFERELNPLRELLLEQLALRGRAPRQTREFLKAYADAVVAQPDPRQGSMFAGPAGQSKEEILGRIIATEREAAGAGGPLFEAAPAEGAAHPPVGEELAGRPRPPEQPPAGEVAAPPRAPEPALPAAPAPAGAAVAEQVERWRRRSARLGGRLKDVPTHPGWLAEKAEAEANIAMLARDEGALRTAAGNLEAAEKFWPDYGGSQLSPDFGRAIESARAAVEQAAAALGVPVPTARPTARAAAEREMLSTVGRQLVHDIQQGDVTFQQLDAKQRRALDAAGLTDEARRLSAERQAALTAAEAPPAARPPTEPPAPPAARPPGPPEGGAGALGPPPTPDSWLPTIKPTEEILRAAYNPDWMRRLADRLDNPITRAVGQALGIPRRDLFTQATVLRESILSDWKSGVTGAIARLRQQGSSSKIFAVDRDGFANIAGRRVPIGDLLEYPGRYDLTPEQKRYAETIHRLYEDQRLALAAEGIDVRELGFEEGGRYVGRRVVGRMDPQGNVELAEIRAGAKGRVGGKAPFERRRTFETQAEAMEAGFRYLPPEEALQANLVAAGRKIADRRFADFVLQQVPYRTASAPEDIAAARDFAKEKLAAVAKLQAVIYRGYRGERVPPATIASIGRFFPEAAAGLVEAGITKLEAPPTRPVGRELLQKVEAMVPGLKTRAQADYYQAQNAMGRAMERARAARYGEGVVPSPAFQGKFFSEADAKRLRQVLDLERPSAIRGGAEAVSYLNALPRLLMTTFDIGPAFLQGQIAMFSHFDVWSRAVGRSMQALVSEKGYQTFLATHADTIRRWAPEGAIFTRSEFTETALPSGLGGRIPGLRTAIRPFARSWEALLTAMRIYGLEATEHMARTPQDRAGLARFWNEMAGQTDTARMGISPTQRELETAILFAPRYRRAVLALMTDISKGGLRGKMARDAVARTVLAGLTGYVAIWMLANRYDPESNRIVHLDPREGGRFLVVRLLGMNIGMGGTFYSTSRALLQMALEPDRAAEIAGAYVRNALSPVVGTAVRFAQYPYVYDSPLKLTKEVIARNLTPIWAQGRLIEDQEGAAAAVGMAGEMMGLRTFPERTPRGGGTFRYPGPPKIELPRVGPPKRLPTFPYPGARR